MATPFLGRYLLSKFKTSITIPRPPSDWAWVLLLNPTSSALNPLPSSSINPIVCDTDKPSVTSHCAPIHIHLKFSSVQLLSCVRLFATPWIAARQTSLSIKNSQSLLKLMPIELVMPSSHLILCCPLLLLPPIPPNIRVFSNELTLHMRWPTYWSFSFSISPSSEHPGLISFKMDWLDLCSPRDSQESPIP